MIRYEENKKTENNIECVETPKIQYLRRFLIYDKNIIRLPRQYLEMFRKSLKNQRFCCMKRCSLHHYYTIFERALM